MIKSKISIIIFCLTLVFAVLQSCKKNNVTPTDTDIYAEIMDTEFVYSQFTPTIVKGLDNSPRGWERLKFNKIAFNALDGDGRLSKGSSFPDGALIVKEAYESKNGNLFQYAVMKKDQNNRYSKKGWLWTEINVGGKTTYGVSMKGKKCINCHSNPPNRDITRTFELR